MIKDRTATNHILSCGHCAEYEQIDRRTFLHSSLPSAAAWVSGGLAAFPAWMPRVALADPHVGPRGDALVCIFLRGGADGLNIVIPHGDEAYYAQRPTLGIPRPDDTRQKEKVIDLDGFFGLHPALSPLGESHRAGALAVVHATGTPDETRSHFEAMALMERGATTNGGYSGWLTRHLASLDTGNDSALRAIAMGEMLPASLTGAVSATALQSITDYHLQGQEAEAEALQTILRELYSQQEDILAAAASRTLDSMDVLSRIDIHNYQPAGRDFPDTDFGKAMQSIAQLIHADVGVEVACVDLGGWDTHAGQGGSQGQMASLLAELGRALAAFHEDISAQNQEATVVVMSEFGRRVRENAALGTDHGHGNMMLVLGDGIKGGVYARWPGLNSDQLTGPGDLAITTDYRDVLGEVLSLRLNAPDLGQIFPGYTVNPLGLAIRRT